MFNYIINRLTAVVDNQRRIILLLAMMMITACSTTTNQQQQSITKSTSADLYDKQFYLLAQLSEVNSIKAGNNKLHLPKPTTSHSLTAVTKNHQPELNKLVNNKASVPVIRHYYLPQPIASAAKPLSTPTSVVNPAGKPLARPVAKPMMKPITKPIAVTLPVWSAEQGQTLRDVVENWAERAGYQVVWDANYDYSIRANLQFNLTFIEAIQQLFNAYLFADRPFLVDVYQHQKLVYVRAKDA